MMSTESFTKWEPVDGINFPCSDISFKSRNRDGLIVVLHFSLVVGNPPKDLKLTFKNAISLRWEEELGVWLIPLPDSLPTLSSEQWNGWRFPLLKVVNSKLLAEVSEKGPMADGCGHFIFTAMNDTLEVLANEDVEVKWVNPVEPPNPSVKRDWLMARLARLLPALYFKR